ncbi:MAG: cobalamin biosynthesis protein CbiX [Actinomycetia bacterium]|nr:cobalamin biosynthesis protein CbiX [Actinomycetes bacterium]
MATILVAHGSRNEAAQRAHEQLVDAVAARLAGDDAARVLAAYLEMADPDIATAIDSAVANGAMAVRILPCFLHPGNHVEVDIPAIARVAADDHPEVSIEVLSHLGSHEALVGMLADMLSDDRPAGPAGSPP